MIFVSKMLRLKLLIILSILTKSELYYLFYKNDNDQNYSNKPIFEIYDIEDFQYIVFSLRVSWLEAKVLCLGYNGQLAKIDTMTKAKSLIKNIENSNIEFDQFWIGGYQLDQLWIWIDKTNIPINPTDGFPPWNRKPLKTPQQCLALDRNPSVTPIFTDLNCNLLKYFICEKELNIPINKDILLPSLRIPFYDKVFLLYNYKTTWYKASGFCRMKGYRLAIISDMEEVELLAKRMIQSRPSFENVWIAGYHFHNNWRWLSTGKIITNNTGTFPWYQNHINRTTGCILLDRHINENNFVVTNCQNERKILCETYDPDETPKYDFEMIPIWYKNCSVFLVTHKLTWNEAFEYCSNQYLYLAETEDDELLKIVSETISNQILEIKHLWFGGIFNNSDWVWATSGNKISHSRMEECIDNKDLNNTNHCLNVDMDMNNKPKLYGIKCKSDQFSLCMENSCSKEVALTRVKNHQLRFRGEPAYPRRRKKMIKIRKTISKHNESSNNKNEMPFGSTSIISSETAISTSNIYPISKLNNTTKLPSVLSKTTIKVSKRNQDNEQPQICLNRSLPIKLNGILNIAFFTPTTYWEALKKCQNYGGNLANINRSTTYLVIEKLENCKETDLWIYEKNYLCARLQTKEIFYNEMIDQNTSCTKKFGSLCKIDPKMGNYSKKELKVKCKKDTVMFGANILSYSNQNWITIKNVTVNFPLCLSINEFQNHFLNMFSKLMEEHYGFLFIMDRSTKTHATENISLDLSFMEAILNIFNFDRDLPSGLILFEENAEVAIPYNQTNYCQIRKKILNLRMLGGLQNKLSFYVKALNKAETQINKYQPQRKTLIFFISNNINNGEEYFSILHRLQRNHTIFSVRTNPDSLTDLNYISSFYKNNLLMYGFKDYIHMYRMMVTIKYRKGNPWKCSKESLNLKLPKMIEDEDDQ